MNNQRETAITLSEKIHSHEITVEEALDDYLEQIKTKEPKYHAFISIHEEQARAQAKEVQARLDCGEYISPLAGVCIAVKDNICTKGMLTTCGSKMLESFVPPYDATVIEKLRNAGMIILGKTNMDEFAMGSTTETSYYGATCNPIDKNYSAGGSSGGSATAVALQEVPLALGSDTGGSIRLPASHCGVVGCKPTYGHVSRYGLVAYASSLEQIGPIGANVSDVSALLDILTDYDKRDATSGEQIPSHQYLQDLKDDVEGIKIGIPTEYMNKEVSPEVRDAIKDVAEQYRKMGALVEEITLNLPDTMAQAYYIIACAQASSNLARFDGVKYGYRTANYNNLEELYIHSRGEGFGKECKKRIMLGTFALSVGYYDTYYLKSLAIQEQVRECYRQALQQVDLLLSPVSPQRAPKLENERKDTVTLYQQDTYTIGANLAGVPAISIPYAKANGLPIGIQLTAGWHQEQLMLNGAYAYEQRGEAK